MEPAYRWLKDALFDFRRHTVVKVIAWLAFGGLATVLGAGDRLFKATILLGHSGIAWIAVPALAFWVILSPILFIFLFHRILAATTSPAAAYLDSAKDLLDIVENAGHRIERATWAVVVRPDYTLQLTYSLTVAAEDKPLFAIKQNRGSSNAPVQDLSALKFRAKWASGGGSVCVIPALDHPTQREFVVILDPPLEPGQSARELVIESEWPGCAKKLRRVGVADNNQWDIPSRLAGPVGELNLKVKIDRRIEGAFMVRLRCPIKGFVPPADHEIEGGEAWAETIRDVPPGATVRVRITRVR